MLQGGVKNNHRQNTIFYWPHAAYLELSHPKPCLPWLIYWVLWVYLRSAGPCAGAFTSVLIFENSDFGGFWSVGFSVGAPSYKGRDQSQNKGGPCKPSFITRCLWVPTIFSEPIYTLESIRPNTPKWSFFLSTSKMHTENTTNRYQDHKSVTNWPWNREQQPWYYSRWPKFDFSGT